MSISGHNPEHTLWHPDALVYVRNMLPWVQDIVRNPMDAHKQNMEAIRGRGTASNPANRFARLEVQPDPENTLAGRAGPVLVAVFNPHTAARSPQLDRNPAAMDRATDTVGCDIARQVIQPVTYA